MSLYACLRDLERIKRKSLRRLSENCKSECVRDSTCREIQENYEHAEALVGAVYRNGGKLNLSRLEQYAMEKKLEYLLPHLIGHIKQIRMLAQRH